MNWIHLPSGKLINLDAIVEVAHEHGRWCITTSGELRVFDTDEFVALRAAILRDIAWMGGEAPVASDPPAVLQSEE